MKPSVVALEGVGAHLAISSAGRDARRGRGLLLPAPAGGAALRPRGPAHLALGRLRLESALTGETLDALFGVLHFGAADFRCGLVPLPGRGRPARRARGGALLAVETLSLAQLLREVDRLFPGRDYELRDLFLDERRRVAELLLAEHDAPATRPHYHEIFEDNRRLMQFLREIDSPIAGPLRVAADVTLTRRPPRRHAAPRSRAT